MTGDLATDEGAVRWLTTLLGPSPAAGPRIRWSVLPSRHQPHRLIPLGCGAATRAVLASIDSRLSGPLALATRVGLPLGRHRLSVAREGSLVAWLATRLGHDDLHVGVSIGPPRPNRKPVLQVVDGSGSPVAWVKVAWNDLTRTLVTNEARWLRRIAEVGPPGLEVPEVIAEETWGAMTMLITRPLPERTAASGPLAGPDLIDTIASLGDTQRFPPMTSPWHAEITRRIAAIGDPAGAITLRGAAREMVERCGEQALAFGVWHGDLTRHNLKNCADRVQVWDWERADGGRPLGMDTAHAWFRDVPEGPDQSVPEAARRAEEKVSVVLAHLGTGPAVAHEVVTAYLIERWVRWAEDAHLGSTTPTRHHHDAILAELARRASE